MSDLNGRIANLSLKKRALLELARQGPAKGENKAEPIAIVGIGCRFPGQADSPAAYWQLLRDGVDAVSEVPADRWDIEAYYDPNPEAPGKMYTRWGGFIRGVDQFEPQFFGIAPREAVSLDPQQRLLLEVAWEALENAGLPPDRLVGTKTGVFVGMMTNDYAQLNMHGYDPTRVDVYSGSGVDASFAAGRLSYVLGLQGPSMVIETACSSALVGVHLACQSLRSGESDVALAGGVNLILSPEATIYSCRIRSMAADGRCKTYDARADGYVRGEGCGVVVLKRLADAVRDGDPIWAMVRGSAINHDGKSSGLTVPNAAAQQAVIRSALRNAGVLPNAISYVEGHGTGTPLGDPIEIRALWSVLGEGRAADQPLLVGSAKTNLGHLEAAAGMAGLIKTVLALHHQAIPPHLHLRQLNPRIDLNDTCLQIPTELRAWAAAGEARFAAVSAFGLSGTNAHVVLEQAPVQADPPETPAGRTAPSLLPLSARTPEALRALAARYAARLAEPHAPALADIAAAAGAGRSHFAHRAAILASEPAQALAAFSSLARGQPHPALLTGQAPATAASPRIVFVCAGQGGQWPGMLAALRDDPLAAAALERVARAAPADLGWDLAAVLADPAAGWLDRIEQLQPVLFALQLALAARLAAWGIRPAAVVGHSFGEVAAAYLAGALSLEDALRVICARSRALATRRGQGAMAVVELDEAAAAALLAEPGAAGVSVAGVNGPRSTLLAGEPAAVRQLVAALGEQGVFARVLAVDVAAHSGQLDGLVGGLAAELSGLAPQAERLALYSTVTGRVQTGAGLDGAYWARNLRAPVRFWEAMQALVADGYRLFVELGPHPTLTQAVGDGLRALGVGGQALAGLRREAAAGETLRELLGGLYCAGASVDWAAVAAGRRAAADLPTYPFQRERYWIEAIPSTSASLPDLPPSRTHPLLGLEQVVATQTGTTLWTRTLTATSLPELPDHRVEGAVVLPGAAFVEMLLAAGRTRLTGARLAGVSLSRLLALPAGSVREVQTVLVEAGASAQAQVLSRLSGEIGPWTRHAQGTVQPADDYHPAPLAVADIRARCSDEIRAADYYQLLAGQGLDYGPAFRRLAALWRRDGEVLAQLTTVPEPGSAGTAYHVPPTLLDACFQALGAALPLEQSNQRGAPALPVGVEDFRLLGDAASSVWVYARLDPDDPPDAATITGDVFLLGANGDIILEARGFRLRRLNSTTQPEAHIHDWLYELAWERQEDARPDTKVQAEPGSWLIFASRETLSSDLVTQLTAHGQRCVVVYAGSHYAQHAPDNFALDPLDAGGYQRLLREALPAHAPQCRGVVYLWGLDLAPDAAPASPTEIGLPAYAGLLHLAQAQARAGWRDSPRLWVVTRGAQSVASSSDAIAVSQAPLWGLARTIAIEQPELACTCIDLDPAGSLGAADLWQAIVSAEAEAQIALRRSARYVARLVHRSVAEPSVSIETVAPAQDRAFRLELATPGILDGLSLRAMQRCAPGAGDVEIAVEAAGLNFLDVLGALGARPDQADSPLTLGGECAGSVTRVGSGVTGVAVGDAVVALSTASFATHVTTSALLVVPKPPQLSFAEAATIPVVFLTAYYALHELGRLQSGERVLIHSAAGGTGLAALQLAQRAGAQVFATAGSAAKREFLQTLGVCAIGDSRSLDFVEQFRKESGGRGMDVVLNALTGSAMEKSLALLAPYGRFLEIAKKEIYANTQIGLEPFRQNLSYFAIDLARMIVERPDYVRRMLVEIMRLFTAGELRPLPLTTYPIAQAADAFRVMAQARHIGKLVLTLKERTTTPIATAPAASRDLVRTDGAYLISGGLGGLGLRLAAWLVRQGARHLVLIGRRPPSPAAEAALAELRGVGATVHAVHADVADRPALAALMAQFGASRPPLRGVIHAAAVLDDATLLNLDAHRLSSVLAPKLDGAWHLHTLTRDLPLDFFVLFSSAAGLLGSPGQANYAAANAFLDALAHYRHALRLPALSINWGPWAEVGLAAAQANRGQRLAVQGLAGLSPAEGLAALEFLLRQPGPHAAVMKFNLRHWGQLFPRAAGAPLLAKLREASAFEPEAGQANPAVRAALQSVAPGLRLSLLEAHLIGEIALVLRLPPDQIDSQTPLPTLGLDSLMALELRNRLELSLGVTLSATLIWSYPTVASLAPFMAEKMGIALVEAGDLAASRAELDTMAPASGLADLSEEDAALLLAEKLANIDRDYLDDEPTKRSR